MTDRIARRPIGNTGLVVSTLGLGCMGIGGQFADIDAAAASATIAAALDEGITFFDTAPQYGCGLSEERVGAGLASAGRRNADTVVSTKVGKAICPLGSGGQAQRALFFPGGHDAEMVFDYSYDGTMRMVDASLTRLGREHVDMLLIHDVIRHFHGDAIEAVLSQAMGGALRALHELRDAGRVKAIGIGLKDCDIAARFIEDGDIDVALLPGRLNLLDQSAATSGVLDLCLKHGVAMIAAAPFDTGILVTGPVSGARAAYQVASDATIATVQQMLRICSAHNVPLAAAALQYPLAHPAVASVLAGMKTVDEVKQNATWMRHPIPAVLWSELASACGTTVLADL